MANINPKLWAIKRVRDRLNLSQQKLADLLNVDVITVSRWENEHREPPPYLWRALRDIERELSEDA